jgi:hypothetical protein
MARFTHPSKGMLAVYEMMKDGKSCNFEKMVKALNCSEVTAMVHICALRRDFNAEIETERDGRKVVAYKLTNAADIAPRMVLKSATKTKAPKVIKTTKVARVAKTVSSKVVDDGSVATLDDLSITEVDDRELADLKSQLGIA